MILQADSDPGRHGVGPLQSSLSRNVQGVRVCVCVSVCLSVLWGLFRGRCFLGVSLYCASSAPFSSIVTLQGCFAHWGEQEKGKWRVMIPGVHVLDADANAA